MSNITKNIRVQLATMNKSKEWLAKEIGISGANLRTTLHNIDKGKNVTLKTLEKIAEGLNVDLKSLIWFF